MKKLVFLLAVSAFVFSCKSAGEKHQSDELSQQEIVVDPANVQFVDISVEGMTCSGCENTVEKSVLSLEGVMEAEASHHEKLTTVKFDKTKVTAEEMMARINEKGYEALEYKIKDDTE